MTTDLLIQALQTINTIKYGDFTLKSGQKSSIYVDLRSIISYPEILQQVSEKMWQKIAALEPKLLCGVPYTALPIATVISVSHSVSMIMRRKEAKDYGTKKMIEGHFEPGQNCIIVEDVITTGGSVIETAELLKSHGMTITDIVVFVDRQQVGKENLTKEGYQVHAVYTLDQLKAAKPE